MFSYLAHNRNLVYPLSLLHQGPYAPAAWTPRPVCRVLCHLQAPTADGKNPAWPKKCVYIYIHIHILYYQNSSGFGVKSHARCTSSTVCHLSAPGLDLTCEQGLLRRRAAQKQNGSAGELAGAQNRNSNPGKKQKKGASRKFRLRKSEEAEEEGAWAADASALAATLRKRACLYQEYS